MSVTTHDEIRDLLAAHAMDLLSPEERASVLAHVEQCGACTAEIESLRSTVGALALAAPDRSFDARRCNGVRSRLLARTAADRDARARLAAGQLPEREPRMIRQTEMPPLQSASRWRVAFMLLAAAVASLILIGGAQLLQSRDELAQARETESQQRRLIAGLMGPGVKVIELAAAEGRPGRARMFWDQRLGAWTFIAYELPVPVAGRAYQLWLITSGDRRISAGVFTPSRDGNAVATTTYRLAADSLAAVAVTEEPSGGVGAPTGEIVLVGAAR
jgi:anti-sigma-K factor RskA